MHILILFAASCFLYALYVGFTEETNERTN
jgi:hypothetical protein